MWAGPQHHQPWVRAVAGRDHRRSLLIPWEKLAAWLVEQTLMFIRPLVCRGQCWESPQWRTVVQCNEVRQGGPPAAGIVDTVGTVCPETGFPVAVLGRAWRADGCSMAAPRFRLLRKSTETKECARISGDFAAHSVFSPGILQHILFL